MNTMPFQRFMPQPFSLHQLTILLVAIVLILITQPSMSEDGDRQSPPVQLDDIAKQDNLIGQKLSMLESLINSASIKLSLMEYNSDAQESIDNALRLKRKADKHLNERDHLKSSEALEEAFKHYYITLSHINKSRGSTEVERTRYKELVDGINSFLQTNASLKASNITSQLLKAEELSKQDNYQQANKILSEAYQWTINTITLNTEQKTVVYQLDLDTPAKEFQYELSRFDDNQRLVEMLIKQQREQNLTASLVNDYKVKANNLQKEAVRMHEQGESAKAVEKMERANKLMKGLQSMLGLGF